MHGWLMPVSEYSCIHACSATLVFDGLAQSIEHEDSIGLCV